MTMAATPLAVDLNHVLDRVLDVREDPRGKCTLSTGGARFRGCGPLSSEVRSRACLAKAISALAPAAAEVSPSRRATG